MTSQDAATTRDVADAYLEASDDAKQDTDTLGSLLDAFNELNGVGQSAASADLQFKDALAELDDTIRKARDGVDGYALGLDDDTEAGRQNMAMLIDLANKSQEAADKQFDLDQNTDAYKQWLIDGRQALIERAKDLGANKDEAKALADQLYAIPDETEFKVIADTWAAEAAMQRLRDALNYVDNSDPVIVVSRVGGGIGRRAGGDAIHGPGTGTSDSAGLYALSNGEHVMTAEDVRAMGGQHAVYAFRDSLHGGGGGVAAQAGPSFTFNGTYAPTADELFAEADKRSRRAMAVEGL